jgi:hypothetical protein
MDKHKEVECIDVNTYAGKAANACKIKARGIIGDDLITFKLLDFISIMLINNKFLDRGIAITDNNKEECYIKIIETGDESLINDLETYLSLKDSIKHIQEQKNEYTSIISKLQQLSNHNDRDAVNSIVEEYLRR